MGVLSKGGRIAVLVVGVGILVGDAAAQEPLRGAQGPYRGRVVEDGTGQPVAGAGVFILWSAADEPRAFEYREAQTDAQGQFTIDATAVEQALPPRALQPQMWVYKPGYQLSPDYNVQPRGAPATVLTRPGAVIQLIGARTDTERIEAFNDFFVYVINRRAPTAGPILLGLMEAEFNHLKQVSLDKRAAVSPPSPAPSPGARGPCEVDPANPPALPPPKPPKVPEPGKYNPLEGRRAPYYGKVVDAQTGAPLVGAVVVAAWMQRLAFPFGATSQFYDACEVLTGSNGRFILDGRAIEASNPKIEAPWFNVFSPGYSVFPESKVTSGEKPFIQGDGKAFHDVTIGLVKLSTREERLDTLRWVGPASGPPPEKTPKLRKLKEQEYVDLGDGRK